MKFLLSFVVCLYLVAFVARCEAKQEVLRPFHMTKELFNKFLFSHTKDPNIHSMEDVNLSTSEYDYFKMIHSSLMDYIMGQMSQKEIEDVVENVHEEKQMGLKNRL